MKSQNPKWTNEMSVGNKALDAQHKKLFKSISKLKEQLTIDIDIVPVREIIDFLFNYSTKHLVSEEKYMQNHNYPDYLKHKKLHKEYLDFFTQLKEELFKEYTSNTFVVQDIKGLLVKTEKFLTSWWTLHILSEDQKYHRYIRARK